ncbi:MAG: SigB/SigF/SigG family RNA polymerase sigma factor, partial [Anaeroplasmataceae bacterium]|nr:SigB/SigF/SigG family RNA polymerase sigma factor [Anaeroplasmataceae bacterium]
LVLSVLKRFNDRKESMDDLFQVGCIGLMKAIDNFDLSHNVRFSTYACPMIIGEVRRHLRDNGAIRVSRSYKDIAYKAIGYKDKFLLENHREPSINEIAEHLNVDSVDVILALEAIQDTISMSTPIYDNGGDVIELEDQIGGTDYITENWMRNNMIKEAFSKLSKREQAIIYDRYYLDKTQMEIAEELSISQAQVSRLEKNALKIMYDYMQ